jgi:hypothetical protein
MCFEFCGVGFRWVLLDSELGLVAVRVKSSNVGEF